MKNQKLMWFFTAAIIAGVGLMFLLWFTAPMPVVIVGTAVPPLPTLSPARVTQGERLYAQNCAMCHGPKLEGASNWKERLPDGSLRPPPHDSSGHTWHHTDELLISIVLNGGDVSQQSTMPAFKDKLTHQEVIAILDFFKSNWDKDAREFQWWITARDTPK